MRLKEVPAGWLTAEEIRVALNCTRHQFTVALQALGDVPRAKVRLAPELGFGRMYAYPPEVVDQLRATVKLSVPLAGPDMISRRKLAAQVGLSVTHLDRRMAALGIEPAWLRPPRAAAQPHYPRSVLQLLEEPEEGAQDWIPVGEAVRGEGTSCHTLLKWCRRRGIEVRVREGAKYAKYLVQRGAAQRWRAETGRAPLETLDLKSAWVPAAEAVAGTGQGSTALRLWCERRGIEVRREGRRLLVPADAARAWSERLMPGMPTVATRPKGWLGREQAGALVGVGVDTMGLLAARGEVQATSVRGRWFFCPESVAALAQRFNESPPPGAVRVTDWSAVIWFRRRGITPRQYRNPDCPRNRKVNYVTAAEWMMFEQRERRGHDVWQYRRDRHRLKRNCEGRP